MAFLTLDQSLTAIQSPACYIACCNLLTQMIQLLKLNNTIVT